MSAERDALAYLEALHGERPEPSVIAVTTTRRDGKFDRSHFVRSPADALGYVLGAVDAYVRVTPLAAKPRSGRGTAEDAIALPAVWADLDVNGTPARDGEPKTGAFPSVGAAIELAHCALEPSLLVGSGGGVQPYWLLDHPLELRSAEDRERARGLVEGFQRRLQREARERFDAGLDSVADLARVLRPPGSANGKGSGKPRPVELLDDGGRRYTFEQLAAEAIDAEPRADTGADPDSGRSPGELIALFPKLGQIVRRKGKAPRDSSPSGWDYYLACESARCGLSDGEIAALIRFGRPGDPKVDRDDYIPRTIAAARGAVGSGPALRISKRWGLGSDPIVSGETIGDVASGGAVVYLHRRSGTRLRLPNLGDLFEPRVHNRVVSLATRSKFPRLTEKEAQDIAQDIIELCGGEDADPLAEAGQWISDFTTGLGAIVDAELEPEPDGKPTWASLTQWQETQQQLNARRDGRAVAMRDTAWRLWLPAAALRASAAAGSPLTWPKLAARLREIGWRREEVQRWDPGVKRSEGAKRIHGVFYVGEDGDRAGGEK